MKIHIFTFNPFSENTYLVSGDDQTCTIIDPGCYDASEFETLSSYITTNQLRPTKVVLTHAHLDHIFGLKRCLDKYDIPYYMSDLEQPVLQSSPQVAGMYGVVCEAVDQTHKSLGEGDDLQMGGMVWDIMITPGHSPGSLCFHEKSTHQLIGGDVLFRDSIGRTDLPGGDHETLLSSIKEKLYPLPDATIVYPGHGPETTIGHERQNNPFVTG